MNLMALDKGKIREQELLDGICLSFCSACCLGVLVAQYEITR